MVTVYLKWCMILEVAAIPQSSNIINLDRGPHYYVSCILTRHPETPRGVVESEAVSITGAATREGCERFPS